MELKDKPVFPSNVEGVYGITGLTYREWLIGMLASNSEMFKMIGIYKNAEEYRATTAKEIISTADAIISELEKE